MFHVKQCLALAGALWATGCGYSAVAGAPGGDNLSVHAAPSRAADGAVQAALVSGARAELGREGALGSADGYPRLVVEVLRVDDQGVGLIAEPDVNAPGGRRPVARGVVVAVVARAWVEPSPGQREWETGDVRRTARRSPGAGSGAEEVGHQDALRRAAREAGRALARRALGQPEPRGEPLY